MTSFKVRFTGISKCGDLRGLQWQAWFPDGTYEPWQPWGDESKFLDAGRDFVALGRTGSSGVPDTLWMVSRDTVTVFYGSGSTPPFHPFGTGVVEFVARVSDRIGESPVMSRRIEVNYPPTTQLFRSASCPPAVPAGWITGIGSVEFPIDSWIAFCSGDTLPNESHVRLYARGRDDPRDGGLSPRTGFAEPRIHFSWFAQVRSSDAVDTWAQTKVPLPGGSSWRGAAVGWRTCPFDYHVYVRALDEQGVFDPSPDSIDFYVNGSPTLDSLYAPAVIVFVPQCGPQSPVCDSVPRFGPDTLAVLGRWSAAPPGTTPLDLGLNEFEFPFRAWGHDHPRDRNSPGHQYHEPARDGGIHAWKGDFRCVRSDCDSYFPPATGNWVQDVPAASDPAGEQVWDPHWRYDVALDTLCTTSPCSLASLRVKLDIGALGEYVLSLQGRDTDALGQECQEPTSLGPNARIVTRGIADLGRTTRIAIRRISWRQLLDVRPPRIPASKLASR